MKLFDKYILREFAIPFLTIVVGFVLLFVVFDLSSRLDDFIRHGMSADEVLAFYYLYVPQMIVAVAPISLLLAIFFSLGRLNRNREILALRASGVSLIRIGRPLFMVGAVCIIFVFFVNEYFVTQTYAETQEFIDRIKDRKREPEEIKAKYFKYKGGTLFFNRFDTRLNRLEGIMWDNAGSEVSNETATQAVSGRWINGQWWLKEVRIFYSDGSQSPLYARRRMYDWNFGPEELAKDKEAKEMTFVELCGKLGGGNSIPYEQRKNMSLQFNHKLAFPLLNLVVVLISLPLCLRTNISGSIFIGMGLSLLLSFSYYGLFTLGMALGGKGILPPWLAVWSPNIIFMFLGGILTVRMER